MKILLILYIVSGLLIAALAVPLIQRRIGPNPYYGFRVTKTLEDRAVWYDANEYSGRQLLWIGIATAVAAAALYYVPGMTTDKYAIACSVVMIGSLLVSFALSMRYLNTL